MVSDQDGFAAKDWFGFAPEDFAVFRIQDVNKRREELHKRFAPKMTQLQTQLWSAIEERYGKEELAAFSYIHYLDGAKANQVGNNYSLAIHRDSTWSPQMACRLMGSNQDALSVIWWSDRHRKKYISYWLQQSPSSLKAFVDADEAFIHFSKYGTQNASLDGLERYLRSSAAELRLGFNLSAEDPLIATPAVADWIIEKALIVFDAIHQFWKAHHAAIDIPKEIQIRAVSAVSGAVKRLGIPHQGQPRFEDGNLTIELPSQVEKLRFRMRFIVLTKVRDRDELWLYVTTDPPELAPVRQHLWESGYHVWLKYDRDTSEAPVTATWRYTVEGGPSSANVNGVFLADIPFELVSEEAILEPLARYLETARQIDIPITGWEAERDASNWLFFVPYDRPGWWEFCRERNVLLSDYQPEHRDYDDYWASCQQIQPGDTVIAYLGNQLIGDICEVTGAAFEHRDRERTYQVIPVSWLDLLDNGFALDREKLADDPLADLELDAATVHAVSAETAEAIVEITEDESLWSALPEQPAPPPLTLPHIAVTIRRPTPPPSPSLVAVLSRIADSPYVFSDAIVTNYHLSLLTKPFVILTGLSGTGKTKLTRLYADAVHGVQDEQHNPYYTIVAVRPDWTDNRGLLGYFNPLTHNYEATPFLRFVLQAAVDPEHWYYLCLDEMNLARVEYYFSDFLSAMESGEPVALHSQEGCVATQAGGGLAETRPLAEITPTNYFVDGVLFVPPSLRIPPNLALSGTVNVDETTHAFSDKVLDRANSIEFNRVDLDRFARRYCERFADRVGLTDEMMPVLNQIYNLLEPRYLHFGYRTLEEVLGYLWQNEILPDDVRRQQGEVLDNQLMQKVLPKLRGDERVRETLSDLRDLLRDRLGEGSRSADKLERMLDELDAFGSTEFWR